MFGGAVVRKDLVKTVKGNAIVPSFVLEYLLGQYAASDDEATIQSGIESVRKILTDHYVHRNQAELVKSHIRGGRCVVVRSRSSSTRRTTPTRPNLHEPRHQAGDRRAGGHQDHPKHS